MKLLRKLLTSLFAFSMVFTSLTSVQAKENTTSNRGTVIKVTDYGADSSGMNDSTLAVIEALEEAKKVKGKVTVEFPTGEYHFFKENATQKVVHTSNTSSLSYPTKWISILIEGQENLTIDGLDSKLIFHGDVMSIAVIDSKNINLENFVLDYKDADTVDLTVVGRGEENGLDYTDFYVPENYNYVIDENKTGITWQGDIDPNTGKPYWTGKNSFGAYLVVYKGYDQTVSRHQGRNADGLNASDPFTGVTKIEELGENKLRFTYGKERPTAHEEGNIFLLTNSARRTTAGAFIWESDTVHMKNLDVHYLSGFGWLLQMSKNIEFNDINFLPRYGSGKYTTSNADQIHAAGVGGYMRVLNSNFSMAHDDPMNIHGTYMRVEEVLGNNKLLMKYEHGQQGGYSGHHEGDEIIFYSRTYLKTARKDKQGADDETPFVVKSSVGPGEKYSADKLPTGAVDKDGKLTMRYEVVEFKDDFSDQVLEELNRKIVRTNTDKTVEPMYVAENTSYSPDLTIKGNKMKSIPTRGILASVRKEVKIEDNIFDNMTMANIYLSNDADYWYESGPIRDMTIKNNKFYIRPTGQSEWGNVSGIFIDPVIVRPYGWTEPDGTPHDPADLSNFQVHKGIKILDNEFHMANDNVVTAEGVEDMEIRGNKIIRDNPDVKIELSSGKNNVEIGKPLALTTNVNENTLSKEVFKFTRSKNIIIEDNTYDDGFNMNITTSDMDESEIKNNDEELSVNGKTNIIKATDKLQFVSADPSIAYINEYQEVVGLKDGFSTEIIAYYEWNGTIYTSNTLTISVGEVEGSALEVTVKDSIISAENESIELDIKGKYDSIQLLDPVTLQPVNIGKVEGTTYTALREGLVLVQVKNANATSAVLLSNKFDVTYGGKDFLDKDKIVIRNETSNWLGIDKYNIKVIGERGDWYNKGDSAKNIMQYQLPEELTGDFRVQVTAKNLPINGVGSYLNGGIALYKGPGEYLSVGKKSHMSGLAVVHEKPGASPTEVVGKAEDNGLSDTVLEISLVGSTATLKALRSNGEWFTVGEYEVENLKDVTQIAFAAWNEGSNPTFGEVKYAKATDVTSEELMKQDPSPLFKDGEINKAPTVDGLTIEETEINKSVTVEYNFTDADNDAEARSIFKWVNEHNNIEDVTYTTSPTYTPRYAGTLKVSIIPVDARGKVGLEVFSDTVAVLPTDAKDAVLNSLYVNGLALKEFKSEILEYDINIPADHKNIHLTYNQSDAGVFTQAIDSKGNELATSTESNFLSFEVPADGVVKIVRHNRSKNLLTYTLNVKFVENNNSEISSITVGDHLLDTEIVEGSDSYYIELTDDENIVDITVSGADENQILTANRSFFEIMVPNSGDKGEFKANVDLTVGLNAFYVNVLAADGLSSRVVRLYVFRSGYNDADAKDISINGDTILGFDPEETNYVLNITPEQAKDFTLSVLNKKDKDQTTSITVNGVTTQGTSINTSFTEEKNTIIVTNQAEDLWTNKFYKLNLIVAHDDNADLLDLSVNHETLMPNFDKDTLEYTINTNEQAVKLSAISEVADANIRMYTKTQYATGTGKVEQTFDIYGKDTKVIVEVTALDGSTVKEYVVNIVAANVAYASDIEFDGTNGYLDIQLDKSNSGSELSLLTKDGKLQTFKKGLGAHAPSIITFNIEGKGYQKFETYVGIDGVKVTEGKGEASVVFKVYVDDELVKETEELTDDSPMEFITVDLDNAKEVKLVAESGANNYSDHANWADAKFFIKYREQPSLETQELEVAIKEAEKLNKDLYTEESWVVFEEALKDANKVLASDMSTQLDIDEVLLRLNKAIDELVLFETPTDPEKPVDPSKPEKPTDPEKPVDPSKPEKPTDPEKPVDPSKPEKPVPPTGLSNSSTQLYISIILGIISFITLVKMKKKRTEVK